MNKQRKTIIYMLFTILFYSSCNTNDLNRLVSSNDQILQLTENTQEKIMVPLSTAIMVPSSENPQNELISLTTATIIPSLMLDNEICPDIKMYTDIGDLSGKLVLLDHNNKKLVFFDLKTGEIEDIISDDEQALYYSISQDGKWMAYKSRNSISNEVSLIVINSKKEQIVKITWLDDWSRLAYWVDNQHLIINLGSENEMAQLILDPFTKQQNIVSVYSPLAFNLEWPPNWRGAGPVIYDSSQKYALLAGNMNEYLLVGVESGKIIASIKSMPFHAFPYKSPQWSPDGNQVIISAPNEALDYMNDELFSVSKTGIVTRLTNLTENYSKVSIDRYNFSPDGNYIGFLFSASPSKYSGEQFALLNLSKSELNTYCIQGDETNGEYRVNLNNSFDDQIYTGVIWSPDKHQMIVENRISEDVSNIMLIDVDQNKAFQIVSEKNIQPIGWMVDP